MKAGRPRRYRPRGETPDWVKALTSASEREFVFTLSCSLAVEFPEGEGREPIGLQ